MASGSAAQVYVQRGGVNSQGQRTVQALKSTQVKTDSGLVVTKHEYIEIEVSGRRPQPQAISTRSIEAGSVVYGGTQRQHIPVQREETDDGPTCLVCIALLMAFLAFGSILCGIPAAILACKALASFGEDPESSRARAKISICCSVLGIVFIAVIVWWSTQQYL